MVKLIPIFVYSLFLAFMSEMLSVSTIDEYGVKHYVRKEYLFFITMTIGMAVFVGLRTRGNDTYAYRDIYQRIIVNGSILSGIEWLDLAQAPGFVVVQRLLKSCGVSTQGYLMFFAFATVPLYLWFIRKYTCDIWLSVYYFITMGVYTFAMAAIKQTVCMALLLIATDKAIEKKWLPFLLWAAVAELFHPFAFVYLVIPFLFFSPWSRKTYLLLSGTVLVAVFLPRLFSAMGDFTDLLGAGYSEQEFSGAGVSFFRVAVVWVPVVLSYLIRGMLKENKDRISNLMVNASMINAFIMFIGLFGTANYFARLANYFLIFQVLALPYLFRFFNAYSRKFLKAASVVGFFAYFYYDMALANGAFDVVYRFMTLRDFLTR